MENNVEDPGRTRLRIAAKAVHEVFVYQQVVRVVFTLVAA